MRHRIGKNLGMWMAAALSAVAGTAMAVVVGSAGADVPSGNIIRNPDAETGETAVATNASPPPPEWTRTGNLSLIGYDNGLWDTPTLAAGGRALFAGGPTFEDEDGTATQDIDVTVAAPEIDAGRVTAALAAELGGSGSDPDDMAVTASFLGASLAPLGSLQIGPVTPAERGNVTSFQRRSATSAVPPGTRSIRVVMTARNNGTDFQNRGYADNLSLTLHASQLAVPPAPPPPPAGLPPPRLGERFNVLPLRGQVFVSLPPGSAAARAAASVPGLKGRRFVRLRSARNLPIGSLLDTRRGSVALATARDSAGNQQAGEFFAGVFQVLQSKRRSAKGLTELRLKGASFRRCRARARKGSAGSSSRARAAARKRRTIRRLRGRANGGRFRTRGRYAAATVRGTDWGTIDRCDGTLTRVRRGRVAVRDFRKGRSVLLRAGKSYLARAPG